jgi:hypothetical protein
MVPGMYKNHFEGKNDFYKNIKMVKKQLSRYREFMGSLMKSREKKESGIVG